MLQGMTNTYPNSLFHCYQDPNTASAYFTV